MKNIILALALALGLSLSFVSYGCTYKDVDAESDYEDVEDDEVEVEGDVDHCLAVRLTKDGYG